MVKFNESLDGILKSQIGTGHNFPFGKDHVLYVAHASLAVCF